MTYYELAQEYVEDFLANAGDVETLVMKLNALTNTKRRYDEWDAEILASHKALLGV
jgi:hypothetical protein